MVKINLSFVMYGGLTYGGAHKQAMNLAKILDKDKFSVRYFWSKPALDKFSTFSHPPIDLEFLEDLNKNGVQTVEFDVGYRDISKKNHPWFNTNFFEIFNQYKTDLMFTVRSGQSSFPFIHMDKPFIEWNVFGGVDHSENLVYSVAVSPWVLDQNIKRGGDAKKSGFCFTGISEPLSQENLRQKLGIADDVLVLGFHQRVDDSICGEHALLAWKKIKNLVNKKTAFVILGGSEKYKIIAKKFDLDVGFLPATSDPVFVSKFLNTLDIFTHSGSMGESLGVVIEEAMMHGLPVVAMRGKYNGHVDVIGDVLEVSDDVFGYVDILKKLIENDSFRLKIGENSHRRAIALFGFGSMKKYFEDLFIKQYQISLIKNKKYKTLSLDIYKKNNLSTTIYRLLYKYPILLNNVLAARNIFLIMLKKVWN